MKKRAGFVSNSSSSSFVLSSKADEMPKFSFSVTVKKLGFEKATTLEELKILFLRENYFRTWSQFLEEADEYWLNFFKNMEEEIQKGNAVWFGTISSEGEPAERFFYDHGLPKPSNGKIIFGE